MKKVKLIIAAVAMLSLVSGSAVYAAGFAPGEGLYIGVFGGGGMGVVQAKVTTQGSGVGRHDGGTFETSDGGLGLSGMEYGGMLGYGYKMGDVYAGIEGEWAASNYKFKVTSSVDVELTGGQDRPTIGWWASCGTGCGPEHTITSIEATKDWTGGMFGRLGFYINPDTLLAFKGGVLVSKFEAKLIGSPNYSEDYYGGGPSFGASLESRVADIDPNLSFRIGAVYTDFMTASVFSIGDKEAFQAADRSGHDSEVTGHALSARIGVQYSFFDVNSLF